MLSAAQYSAVETLRDKRLLEIRALRRDDEPALRAAAERTSAHSLYLRFFGVKVHFSEKETEFFLNVDFVNHVALLAVMEEAGRKVVVGGGRYVMVQPGTAEVAFLVIDQYQKLGIGAALMRHLIVLARAAGLQALTAEVLAENRPMLKVFQNCGLPISTTSQSEVVHVTLQLT